MDLTESCYYCTKTKHEVFCSDVIAGKGTTKMRVCCNCGHFALFCGNDINHVAASANEIDAAILETTLNSLRHDRAKLQTNN